MRRLAILITLLLAACTTENIPSASSSVPTEANEPSTDQVAHEDDDHDHDEPTSQPTSMPTEGDEEADNTFGGEFTIDGDPISLADAIDTCANTGELCKVEGTIDRVCQARGCWFTLTAPDVEQVVRVRMQDYAFFVPRDAMGEHVVFEGTLSREEIDQETAQHYADDEAAANGTEARVVTGPEDTYQFMITVAQIDR